MENLSFLQKYKYWILLSVLALVVGLMITSIVIYNLQSNKSSTEQRNRIIENQRTIPGETKASEIKKFGTPKETLDLPGNETQYNYGSVTPLRENSIVTNEDTVIFENIVTADDKGNFTTLSQTLERLGEPDEIKEGSKKYGRFLKTYIYASKGYAVRGNEYKNEIFEIQAFVPMSVEDYLNTWGTDILDYSSVQDHEH